MSTRSMFILYVSSGKKLGGVRKIIFSVGIKFSGVSYTENKMPQAFPGQ